MSDLYKVTIGIKSFLRPTHLYHACVHMQAMLPECRVIIADDSGDLYHQPTQEYLMRLPDTFKTVYLPYDSGFGKKSNAISEFVETPYLLVGSDDFDFSPVTVRYGVDKMVRILDENPELSIVSGRVNNRPYEFDLIDEGETITEKRVEVPHHPHLEFIECDLTVNYSLIRKEVLQVVHWDDDVKIGGGEHGAFFVDVKRAGFKVAYATDVNIMEQTDRRFTPKYIEMRRRAFSPERPCFVKRGIKKYILGDGVVDYDETVNRS